MAPRTTITLQDDLDGGPADVTVRFSLGGQDYEIDLSAKNAGVFRSQLAVFIDHARPAAAGRPGRRARTASSRLRSAAIRAWAKEQGIAVSDRGRIPTSVVEQYQAAARTRSIRSGGVRASPAPAVHRVRT